MKLENQELCARLAGALKKLTDSASSHVGADCYSHARLAHVILQEEGIQTRLVVGEAAWRIGAGDGDVITHSPSIGGHAPAGVKALAYHAWLESDDTIIDFSTHSLRTKAAQLDALDGGTTNVAWCPPYLVIERSQVLSLNEVAQAPREGVAFYQELPGLHEYMVENGLSKEVGVQDLRVLHLLIQQPEIVVFGPNDRAFSKSAPSVEYVHA
jgi:hypothetical protein